MALLPFVLSLVVAAVMVQAQSTGGVVITDLSPGARLHTVHFPLHQNPYYYTGQLMTSPGELSTLPQSFFTPETRVHKVPARLVIEISESMYNTGANIAEFYRDAQTVWEYIFYNWLAVTGTSFLQVNLLVPMCDHQAWIWESFPTSSELVSRVSGRFVTLEGYFVMEAKTNTTFCTSSVNEYIEKRMITTWTTTSSSEWVVQFQQTPDLIYASGGISTEPIFDNSFPLVPKFVIDPYGWSISRSQQSPIVVPLSAMTSLTANLAWSVSYGKSGHLVAITSSNPSLLIYVDFDPNLSLIDRATPYGFFPFNSRSVCPECYSQPTLYEPLGSGFQVAWSAPLNLELILSDVLGISGFDIPDRTIKITLIPHDDIAFPEFFDSAWISSPISRFKSDMLEQPSVGAYFVQSPDLFSYVFDISAAYPFPPTQETMNTTDSFTSETSPETFSNGTLTPSGPATENTPPNCDLLGFDTCFDTFFSSTECQFCSGIFCTTRVEFLSVCGCIPGTTGISELDNDSTTDQKMEAFCTKCIGSTLYLEFRVPCDGSSESGNTTSPETSKSPSPESPSPEIPAVSETPPPESPSSEIPKPPAPAPPPPPPPPPSPPTEDQDPFAGLTPPTNDPPPPAVDGPSEPKGPPPPSGPPEELPQPAPPAPASPEDVGNNAGLNYQEKQIEVDGKSGVVSTTSFEGITVEVKNVVEGDAFLAGSPTGQTILAGPNFNSETSKVTSEMEVKVDQNQNQNQRRKRQTGVPLCERPYTVDFLQNRLQFKELCKWDGAKMKIENPLRVDAPPGDAVWYSMPQTVQITLQAPAVDKEGLPVLPAVFCINFLLNKTLLAQTKPDDICVKTWQEDDDNKAYSECDPYCKPLERLDVTGQRFECCFAHNTSFGVLVGGANGSSSAEVAKAVWIGMIVSLGTAGLIIVIVIVVGSFTGFGKRLVIGEERFSTLSQHRSSSSAA